MASKYDELFSDFKELLKAYKEELDVTPLLFMRLLTQGVQVFQRETFVVEKLVLLEQTTTTPPVMMLPDDVMIIKDVREKTNHPIALMSYDQFKRNVDLYEGGYRRTPNDLMPPLLGTRFETFKDMRIAAVWDRRMLIHPWVENVSVMLYYYPDLYPISRNTAQWSDWYTDEEAFDTQFKIAYLSPALQPYESNLVDYAVSKYLKSKGNINQKIYEDSFKEAIILENSKGKTNFRNGAVDYNDGINVIPEFM